MKLLRVSFTAAAKTFRYVLRNGVSPPNVNAYNVMIRGFAAAAVNLESESAVGDASGLLKATTEKGVEPTFNAIIQGLCREGSIIEAEKMLEEMNRKGLAPDERTYTSLIHLFCDKWQNVKAHEVLNEMILRGFSPSIATYNDLLYVYCRGGGTRVEEAVGILRGMAERGLSPDVVSYTTIISGFCVFDQEVEKALEMKVEMVEKGILPNAATFSMLIRALCREGRLPEAFDLFREMLCGGFSPDKCTYLMLINAYCAEGEFSKVFHLNDEMIHKGISSNFVTGFSPSLVTYNALIHGCCVLRRVEDALGILRGMAELGLSPDAVGYNTVISGFCKIGEPGKAYKLMLEMVGKNIQWLDEDTYESLMEDLSDEDTYSSLMNEYLAEGNLEMAFEFDREVSKNGYLPSHVTYSARLNGLIKKARTTEAKMHLLCMIYNQCLTMPSYITYDTLIENCSNNEFKSVVGLVKGFIKRGLLNEAARAHDTMLHGNYKPDGAVYNLLIFSHSRSLNVDKAYNMYKEMVHYGFDPHMFSVLALIKALYHVRRYDETRWVIQNTLRSCNLNDSELPKVLDEIDVRKFQIHALLSVLAEIAVDGLLLDGGKCSYASASSHRFSPTTIIVFLIFIIKGLVELSLG
ncbi:pentatricopeptide repeat-containing protein At5g39710-like [Lotus japonicus]|uniref:pentatricopeptide repeat-containing protein At5g39710-like n=1 Tax=Lotus japonicus TaxID=34305 RepID=UPI002585930B|nr:pentatricopeptide repeat-containing protein At5g39710-like [Lotus japonicus]